jgi:purine-binding chemotaxis protein CheW
MLLESGRSPPRGRTLRGPPLDHDTRGLSLLFQVRTRLCALPLAHVVETMRPLPVEAMAGGPPCVLGLAIIRGAPVPVVDIARLLGEQVSRPEEETWLPPSARFVTVVVAGRGVALAVDGVVGVRTLALDSLRDLPPLLRDAEVDVVGSIGTLDSQLLLVLRSARLLPQGLRGAEGSP